MHKNNNMMLIFNRKKGGNYQQKKKSHQLYDSHIVSDSSKCGLVANLRTFMEDYIKVVEFCEWLKRQEGK